MAYVCIDGYASGPQKNALADATMNFAPAVVAGIVLAAVGVLMMAFGIYRGEMMVVLTKAVNICMECIGIG